MGIGGCTSFAVLGDHMGISFLWYARITSSGIASRYREASVCDHGEPGRCVNATSSLALYFFIGRDCSVDGGTLFQSVPRKQNAAACGQFRYILLYDCIRAILLASFDTVK